MLLKFGDEPNRLAKLCTKIAQTLLGYNLNNLFHQFIKWVETSKNQIEKSVSAVFAMGGT